MALKNIKRCRRQRLKYFTAVSDVGDGGKKFLAL
jgi:hypothetical protein